MTPALPMHAHPRSDPLTTKGCPPPSQSTRPDIASPAALPYQPPPHLPQVRAAAQNHGHLRFPPKDLHHPPHALLPSHRQPEEDGLAQKDCGGSQGHGFQNVGASPDAAVEEEGDH